MDGGCSLLLLGMVSGWWSMAIVIWPQRQASTETGEKPGLLAGLIVRQEGGLH